VEYDDRAPGEAYAFRFSTPDHPTSRELRERYGLKQLVAGCTGDLERLGHLCGWVHGLWQHDGRNEPSSSDPLTILEETAQGKHFRCVEYGVVLSACAGALGLPGRVLSLKTEDAETREFGASHVVSEVFLPDISRWAFVDAQWNVIPMQDGNPLSGVQFRLALNERADLASYSEISEETFREYLTWIDEYLFYFSTQLDNRTLGGFSEGTFSGAKLILGPLGAEQPTVFQRRFPIQEAAYTHSVKAFYPRP